MSETELWHVERLDIASAKWIPVAGTVYAFRGDAQLIAQDLNDSAHAAHLKWVSNMVDSAPDSWVCPQWLAEQSAATARRFSTYRVSPSEG